MGFCHRQVGLRQCPFNAAHITESEAQFRLRSWASVPCNKDESSKEFGYPSPHLCWLHMAPLAIRSGRVSEPWTSRFQLITLLLTVHDNVRLSQVGKTADAGSKGESRGS